MDEVENLIRLTGQARLEAALSFLSQLLPIEASFISVLNIRCNVCKTCVFQHKGLSENPVIYELNNCFHLPTDQVEPSIYVENIASVMPEAFKVLLLPDCVGGVHIPIRNEDEQTCGFLVVFTSFPLLESDSVIQILNEIVFYIRDELSFRFEREIAEQSQNDLQRSQEMAEIGSWNWNVQRAKFSYSRKIGDIYEGPITSLKQFIDFAHKLDRPRVYNAIEACLNGSNTGFDQVFRIISTRGRIKHVHVRGRVKHSGKGSPVDIQGITQDITDYMEKNEELERAKKVLQKSEERFEIAVMGSGVGIWDWDLKSDQAYYSPKFKALLGYDEQEIESTVSVLNDAIHPDDFSRVRGAYVAHIKDGTSPYDISFRARLKNGSYRWFHSVGKAVRFADGRAKRVAGTLMDITEQKEHEQLIWRQAHYDPLTNLPNRRMLFDKLDNAIERAQNKGTKLALLSLDLDEFKEINDTFGHVHGDLLLKVVSSRLSGAVKNSGIIARHGGDEFTILLDTVEEDSEAKQIAQVLLDTFEHPFQIRERVFYITASVGITFYPEDADEVDDLIKNADQAMYAAKKKGRNRFELFHLSLREDALAKVKLIQDLRLAVQLQQFELHYQPIIDIQTGEITRAEALIRWHHPERGMVSPVEFIPVAEETGLIVELGNWVFYEAARKAEYWQEVYGKKIRVAVNSSPVQYRNDCEALLEWLDYLQERPNLGSFLCIEITESLLMEKTDSTDELLAQFQAAGMHISLDDFGTGYSSLSYIQNYKFDTLKIDRSFVSNLGVSEKNNSLCEAIILMAHKLGIQVVAEGIETLEQLTILKEANCDFAQGYYFSKPVPSAEFDALLKGKVGG